MGGASKRTIWTRGRCLLEELAPSAPSRVGCTAFWIARLRRLLELPWPTIAPDETVMTAIVSQTSCGIAVRPHRATPKLPALFWVQARA